MINAVLSHKTSSNWSALIQLAICVTAVKLPVEPQPLITLTIRRGLGKRNLAEMGHWRSEVVCPSTKGGTGVPPLEPMKEQSVKEKQTSWEG